MFDLKQWCHFLEVMLCGVTAVFAINSHGSLIQGRSDDTNGQPMGFIILIAGSQLLHQSTPKLRTCADQSRSVLLREKILCDLKQWCLPKLILLECHQCAFKSLRFSIQDRRVLRVTRLSFLDFRVIVGAPEDENVYQSRVGIDRPGAVYRCQTNPPFNCQQIPFDTSGKKHF